MALIKPHGGGNLKPLFVMDETQRADLAKEAMALPSITISSAAAGNAVMLGGGYFTPLDGFMDKADALGVAKEMKTASGLFWPTPVLNMVEDAGSIKAGDRIALRDPNVAGEPVLAIQDVNRRGDLHRRRDGLYNRQGLPHRRHELTPASRPSTAWARPASPAPSRS